MKVYIVHGFVNTDWEDHFILPKCYRSEETAVGVAKNTKTFKNESVTCYVEEAELEED